MGRQIIKEEIRREGVTPTRTTWFATIHANVADLADMAYVIIPEFDDTKVWGPCYWQARDATSLPAKGDLALVMFDNRYQMWIVAWWPF